MWEMWVIYFVVGLMAAISSIVILLAIVAFFWAMLPPNMKDRILEYLDKKLEKEKSPS